MFLENIKDTKTIISYAKISKKRILTIIIIAFAVVFLDALGMSTLYPIGEYLINAGQGNELNTKSWGIVTKIFNFFGMEPKIETLVIITMLIIILRQIFTYIRIIILSTTQHTINKNLRKLLFSKFLIIDYKYNKRFKTGTYTNVLTNEVDRLGQATIAPIELISGGLILTSYLIMMLILSWEATSLLFIFAIITGLLMRKINTKIYKTSQIIIKANNNFSQHFLERFQALKLIKLNNKNKHETKKSNNILDSQYKENVNAAKLIAITATGLEPLAIIIIVPIIVAAVINGVSLALIGMFTMLIARSIPTFKAIATGIQDYIKLSASSKIVLKNIIEIEAMKELQLGSKKLPKTITNISFENISFKYEDNNKNVLENFSAKILGGKINAVIGDSGSGKSTLINMIPYLLNPTEGNVFINNNNIKEYDIKDLRSSCSFIDQKPLFIRGRILDHLTYSQKELNIDLAKKAVKLAKADSFINEMPGKYDYIIGEGGSGLSGGQLQRLEIARGIASNRPIMILDEPTSNLDSKNANIILNTLKNINLTLGTTIIIISHKQDIDKYCDNIIEINNLN